MTITGSGYPPDEFVALYIDQPSLYIGTPGPRADAQGAFKFQYVWPDQTYDAGRKVNPASPGAHTVCGDTNYGGVTQQFPGKACTQFIVEGTPASPSTNSPAAVPANASGLGPIEVIGGIAILLALAIGATLLIRRSGS